MESNPARFFSQNEVAEGIPFGKSLPGLDVLAVADKNLGAVGHLVVFDLPAPVIENGDIGIPVDDDEGAVFIGDGFEVGELDDAVGARFEHRPFGAAHGDSADVEGPHGQLRARFSDGLGSDNAHRLAEFDHSPGGHIAAVTELANTLRGLAGQDRSDLDALETEILEFAGDFLGDFLVHFDDGRVGVRVKDALKRNPADDAVDERLDDFSVFDNGGHIGALEGSAVMLIDDDLLGDVDKLAGEIPRIGRFQGGVGQTFAGAVGRDEVLKHVQAFSQVGNNGRFNDFTRGLAHETPHAGQLADLLFVAPGPGVGHNEQRIEPAALKTHLLHFVDHRIRDVFGDRTPDLHDPVEPLPR